MNEPKFLTKISDVKAGDTLFSESHRRYIAVRLIDTDGCIFWECYELTPEWNHTLFSIKLRQYELVQGNYRKSTHLTPPEATEDKILLERKTLEELIEKRSKKDNEYADTSIGLFVQDLETLLQASYVDKKHICPPKATDSFCAECWMFVAWTIHT